MIYLGLFISAILSGTLVEWVVHYFILHTNLPKWVNKFWLFKIMSHQHNIHHKLNHPDTILANFLTYVWIAIPFWPTGFFYDWIGGLCFISGSLIYILWLSIEHHNAHIAMQNDDIFGKIIYYEHSIHHQNNKTNFGVTVQWWDYIFNTIKR